MNVTNHVYSYSELTDIHQVLAKADVIITPTKRLARFVEAYWYQQQEGQIFYRKPIESLENWLYQLWQQICLQQTDPPALLNRLQQQYIWSSYLEQFSPQTLLNQQATLQGLLQAWRLVNEWKLTHQTIRQQAFNQDQQLFTDIMHAYQQWCDQYHWIDHEQLAPWIEQHITYNTIQQHNIVLLDFNYTTLAPIYHALLNQLQNLGVKVNCYQRIKHPSHFYYCETQDPQQEIQKALNWLKQQVDHHPKGHFLWIIPNLRSQRKQIHRYLKQTLAESKGYKLNLGGSQPLASIPIIQTALNVIQLKQKPLQRYTIEYLLNSPYIASQAQYPSEYALLRQKITTELPPTIYQYQWNNFLLNSSSSIEQLLYQIHLYSKPETATPIEWAQFFHQLTQMMGWPGVRSLDSHEYQALNTWQQVLDELCQLNCIAENSWSWDEAVKWLHHIAQQKPYQPQSPDHVQVDCLEPMEAVGLHYDGVWIMDCHQFAWPQSSYMTPFLPFNLQRHHDLPHARVEREQRFYSILIQQLLALSSTIHLSYAHYPNDDYECHLSALWANHQPNYWQPSPINDSFIDQNNLESLLDLNAPQVNDPTTINGGSALLQAQALCPFKAWAQFRLNAQPIETQGYLLNNKDKGILLHKALEYLWQHWHDQHDLLKTEPAEIDKLIQQALHQASKYFRTIFPQQLLNPEIERQYTLIKKWLNYEKERPYFQVKALEYKTQLTINQLAIKLKIDRIDQDDQGRLLLIDYKTGQPTPSKWQGDRPEEPQMPLYVLSQACHPISSLAYGVINAKEIRFKGWSSEKQLPHCKEPAYSWAELQAYWQQHLNKLAQQFLQGQAHLDPKHGKATCQYCHLTSFCRRLDNKQF